MGDVDNCIYVMSPYYFGGTYLHVFYVGGSSSPGCLGNEWVDNMKAVRPVHFLFVMSKFIVKL